MEQIKSNDDVLMDERARECSAESRCGDDDAHSTYGCVIRGTTPATSPPRTGCWLPCVTGREKDAEPGCSTVQRNHSVFQVESSRVEERGTYRTGSNTRIIRHSERPGNSIDDGMSGWLIRSYPAAIMINVQSKNRPWAS